MGIYRDGSADGAASGGKGQRLSPRQAAGGTHKTPSKKKEEQRRLCAGQSIQKQTTKYNTDELQYCPSGSEHRRGGSDNPELGLEAAPGSEETLLYGLPRVNSCRGRRGLVVRRVN